MKVANSSNVDEVTYHEDKQQLTVKYKGGAEYRYDNVPTHDGRIIEATANIERVSTGHWINRLIKTPKFPYTKLSGGTK